jgi:dihydrofolate reductase
MPTLIFLSLMPDKPITIVVAAALNGVIGRDNQLPWRLPSDLKHFKETTMGGAVIMGRKTYESLGKPLPGRLNLVVSRHSQNAQGFLFFNSPEKAIVHAQLQEVAGIYLIGGAGLFEQGLKLADTVLLTRVLADVEGDTFFPSLSKEEWSLSENWPLETSLKDEYPCRIETYKRIA